MVPGCKTLNLESTILNLECHGRVTWFTGRGSEQSKIYNQQSEMGCLVIDCNLPADAESPRRRSRGLSAPASLQTRGEANPSECFPTSAYQGSLESGSTSGHEGDGGSALADVVERVNARRRAPCVSRRISPRVPRRVVRCMLTCVVRCVGRRVCT